MWKLGMSDFGVYNENACLKSKKQGSGSFSRENTKGKTQISDFIKQVFGVNKDDWNIKIYQTFIKF